MGSYPLEILWGKDAERKRETPDNLGNEIYSVGGPVVCSLTAYGLTAYGA